MLVMGQEMFGSSTWISKSENIETGNIWGRHFSPDESLPLGYSWELYSMFYDNEVSQPG